MSRAAAALVALICWVGLALQFSLSFANQHDVVTTIWVLLRFFTIITNLLVAIAMTLVAIDRPVSPLVLGGLTLAILLVGIVYATLLAGLEHPTGLAALVNNLLHRVSPLAMPLWWLFFAPRGRLKGNAPLIWVAFPVAYFAYTLARGHFDGRYPYPFINVARIGWVQTALNAGGIALGFIIAGYALVWLDSWRPLGSKRAKG
jgi:hypothetical protein